MSRVKVRCECCGGPAKAGHYGKRLRNAIPRSTTAAITNRVTSAVHPQHALIQSSAFDKTIRNRLPVTYEHLPRFCLARSLPKGGERSPKFKRNMPKIRRYFPSFSRLYISLRIRCKEYVRENTLHGFPYFTDSRRPLWERIIWFTCTMASIAAVIAIIINILETFKRDPSLVGLDTATDDWVTYFPNVMLCQREPNFHFGPDQSNAEHYRSVYAWSWEKAMGQQFTSNKVAQAAPEGYSDIFYRAMPDCQDVYEDCRYAGKAVACGELFRKVLTTRGICCFVPATRITRETGPWGLFARTKLYPISIDLFDEKSSPPEREASFSYYMERGTIARISIEFSYATEAMESISLSRRKCFLPEEHLSYNGCLNGCEKERMLKACGCLPWFLVSISQHERNKHDNKECTRPVDYACLLGQREKERSLDSCGCYLSCNHTSYRFEQLEFSDSDTLEIQMTNWPIVLYKHDVRFGWLDLLVSFGGIAGLFLGYSLLTTAELVYYLFLRSYCGAVLATDQTDKTNKTIRIRVSSQLPVAPHRPSGTPNIQHFDHTNQPYYYRDYRH